MSDPTLKILHVGSVAPGDLAQPFRIERGDDGTLTLFAHPDYCVIARQAARFEIAVVKDAMTDGLMFTISGDV